MDRDEIRAIYRNGKGAERRSERRAKSGIFFRQSVLSLLILGLAFGVRHFGTSIESVAVIGGRAENALYHTSGFAELGQYWSERLQELPVFRPQQGENAENNQEIAAEAEPSEYSSDGSAAERENGAAAPQTLLWTDISGEGAWQSSETAKEDALRALWAGSLTETTFLSYLDLFYEQETVQSMPAAAVDADGAKSVDAVETGGEEAQNQETQDLAALPYPELATAERRELDAEIAVPVKGTVTSPFGYRIHPVTEKVSFHYGVDIAANTGTDIVSAFTGKVEEVGENAVYGKYLIVRFDETLTAFYGHCSEIYVKEGAKVRGGRKIAAVGNTGMSTGSHLHFELRVNQVRINPLYYIAPEEG